MTKHIHNKTESKKFIIDQGFNHFPDLFIHKDDIEGICRFIELHPSPLYILRDGKRPQSDFYFFHTIDECITYLDLYPDIVIIAVSVNAYKDHKIILGTIEITSDNMVNLTASTDPSCDHRSIFVSNDYNIHCSIFSKALNNIPHFDVIYDFLVTNELIDVIVEYTIYDIKVGTKNDYLVIQEIRNY
jgi:hypothetical protein